MSEGNDSHSDEQLDAYLDGVLDERQRAAYEAELESNPRRLLEQRHQQEIDASLLRLFSPKQPSQDHVSAVLVRLEAGRASRSVGRRRVLWIAGLAAAAAIGWVAVLWWLRAAGPQEPYFERSPVAKLYREAIANGFQPYYECDDDQRFAEVFQRRQGKSLHLLPLPEGTRMLGLSYPGGLSRNTTAMLCQVEEVPVMVMVDQARLDHPVALENDDESVRVFREERGGLVFYEATTLDSPSVIRFLSTTPHGR